MVEPRWLTKREVLRAHERQLAEHGGPSGLRDEGLLESALARPENLAAYGDPDVADLAVAYAFGLAACHPQSSQSASSFPPSCYCNRESNIGEGVSMEATSGSMGFS